MPKKRLDLLLVERGLTDTRSKAQRVIMAGQVRVDGQLVFKPASPVDESATLAVNPGRQFVSRGGEKLAGALDTFRIDPAGLTCADVGASTGGFSDCLLQRGAARVYSIDVGRGQLDWKLRSDPRVVVMEQTNARYLETLPEPIDLIAVDASFISLRLLLPVLKNWLRTGARPGAIVALVKPQFEAGRKEADRGEGVIRDPEVHERVLAELAAFAHETGLTVLGRTTSPLLGPKGNTEFFLHLRRS